MCVFCSDVGEGVVAVCEGFRGSCLRIVGFYAAAPVLCIFSALGLSRVVFTAGLGISYKG